MKLTKDALKLISSDNIHGVVPPVGYSWDSFVDEILKNQEDAEKYRNLKEKGIDDEIISRRILFNDIRFVDCVINHKIVERLKKRLEELEDDIEYIEWAGKSKPPYDQHARLDELQKILGDNN